MKRKRGFPSRYEISSYWIPTKESSEKILLIKIECVLNKPLPELNNRTPFEDIIIHKNASNFFGVFPYLKKTQVFKYYQRTLPLNNRQFTYRSVYSKTGGVLNTFNPKIKESMDNQLKKLRDKFGDKKEALNIWKDTSSELWSGLSPKFVWAGGGDVEGQLLTDFLEQLTDVMEGERFESEGDCLISAIKFLRDWQHSPNVICMGETPMDAIIKERHKIYDRKASFLKKMRIETDFT